MLLKLSEKWQNYGSGEQKLGDFSIVSDYNFIIRCVLNVVKLYQFPLGALIDQWRNMSKQLLTFVLLSLFVSPLIWSENYSWSFHKTIRPIMHCYLLCKMNDRLPWETTVYFFCKTPGRWKNWSKLHLKATVILNYVELKMIYTYIICWSNLGKISDSEATLTCSCWWNGKYYKILI